MLLPYTTLSLQVKESIRENVTNLLQLHDELLGALHAVVPFSEYDQTVAHTVSSPRKGLQHLRWYSMDAVPTRSTRKQGIQQIRQSRRSLNLSRSSESEPAVLHCTPQTAAEVARVFALKVRLKLNEEHRRRLTLCSVDETFFNLRRIWSKMRDVVCRYRLHSEDCSLWSRSRQSYRKASIVDKPTQQSYRIS